MTATATLALFRAGDLRTDLAGLDLGGLSVATEEAAPATEIRLIDTFDAQIAAKGRLLVATGDALMLLGEGRILTQDPAEPDFVERMPAGPVTEALAGVVSPLRTLMTVAEGALSHAPVRLLDDYEKTHLRGDAWVLATADGTVTMFDLRALRGYDKSFKQFASALAGARGGSVSNAAEACALLRGEDPTMSGKLRITMTPDERAFRAANDIIGAQIALARRNEAGVIADLDSEFLHEYRVALRRVRSVISLFKGVYDEKQTADLKARFGAIMARTGALRDLDVYMLERDRYIALVPARFRGGLEKLFATFAGNRGEAQAELAAYLGSKGYAKEMAKLEKLFDRPKRLGKGPEADRHALDYAKMLIWKRYKKVCAIARSIGEHTPDEDVHELRIHCKKLRYLMEFFAPLFGDEEVRTLIKSLKRLQDNLGAFNDYSVQQAALQEMSEGLTAGSKSDAVEIATSLGALVTVLHQGQVEERARVTDSFAAFDAPETRAQFRSLFKPEGAAT
ncbi:MAG: CHAD domain-containing protein [Salipiger thiooxidans]|uniref:CHAD domain-containing protein n=1 Tax=Salipiger thiooxidans TaxID=282683 RepID=UPI001CFBA641|nr:CHAD domain-containing protein [Salipiger thiooxidans]